MRYIGKEISNAKEEDGRAIGNAIAVAQMPPGRYKFRTAPYYIRTYREMALVILLWVVLAAPLN